MTSIALVTCAALPELDPDELLLKSALEAEGLQVTACIWTDAGVDWSAYDLVVVRSPWDYTDFHEDFIAWAKRVDAVTTLLNPADVIEWNTDKRYLRDLLDAGVPVVPTVFLEPGGRTEWVPPAGFAEYVVKPAVSAGSRDTMRYIAAESMDVPRAHAQRLLDESRVVMIQPYLDAVDTVGETAVIYMGGEFSHSIRKGPMLAAIVVVVAVLNLVVSSASAKWAFLAPILVPMLGNAGMSPELVQCAYRVGDSCTNPIAPLNAYLVIILVAIRRYQPSAGLGTLIALLVPYCVAALVVWTAVLVAWNALGIPLGF
jgi:hypothetical protein